MKSMPAWIIAVGKNSFALAEKEMIEYIMSPVSSRIPVTPTYSSQVIHWRDSIIPVLDLRILEGDAPTEELNSIVVVAYQLNIHEPLNYVALVISKPPVRVMVSDDLACDAPEHSNSLLQSVSLAYFEQNNCPVSIINLKQLCSHEFMLQVAS